MSEYNVDNMIKLANYLSENMNTETLKEVVFSCLVDGYEVDRRSFELDWKHNMEGNTDAV